MRASRLHGKTIRRDDTHVREPLREGNQFAATAYDASTLDCPCCRQPIPGSAELVQKQEQFLRRLFARQEEIERSVAASIHDDLAQQLTAALFHLEGAQPLPDGTSSAGQEAYRTGLKLVRDGIDAARRIAARVQPLIDHADSVELGIECVLHEMRSCGGPEIVVQLHGELESLPAELGNALLRILRQLLANACAHSRSEEVRLQVVRSPDCLRLEVEDGGVGFDLEEVWGKTLGLQEVQQRARLLGGKVLVDTAPRQGTRVIVSLPLPDPRWRREESREKAIL